MMFTLHQIREAHAKVSSGAAFPAFIQELIGMGVRGYSTYVSDGHTSYHGKEGFSLESEAKYAPQEIAETGNAELFRNSLKQHQEGHSNYPTFCRHCAEAGVEKWAVDTEKMTCAYYDREGREMLVEAIPRPAQ
jgi:uncharacterized protein YbcV (DUF1398 family)